MYPDCLLSTYNWCFKDCLMTDAILEVARIADAVRRGAGRKKGFCALVAIDIRIPLHSARWKVIIEELVSKMVPEYLLRIIEDYLHERKIIYMANIRIEENMTCGVPQEPRAVLMQCLL